MFKMTIKLTVLVLISFSTLSTFAKEVKLLKITSESDPTNTSEIFLYVNDHTNAATHLVFQRDIRKNSKEVMTIQEVIKDEQIVLKKIGIKVIGLSANQVSGTSRFNVNINYLHLFSFSGSTYHNKKILVYYSTPDNTYMVMDMDTKKIINNMHFLSNYIGAKEKGIKSIETE